MTVIMDFLGNNREQNVPMRKGTCDFCLQRKVSLKPLLCQKHFYCRVCEDFSPKFIRKDFTCSRCSHVTRMSNQESLRLVDKYLSNKTGGKKKDSFKEITIAIDATNIITFNEEPDEKDDDNDLSGNNEEWDSLLESLTSEKKICGDENERYPGGENKLEKIPRNMSVIKLVIPPANEPKKNASTRKNKSRDMAVKRSSPEECNQPFDFTTPGSEESNAKLPTGISSYETTTSSNTSNEWSEEERGTSPVKKAFKQSRAGWIVSASSSTSKDLSDGSSEATCNIVTDLESPGFEGDPNWHTNANDDIWNF